MKKEGKKEEKEEETKEEEKEDDKYTRSIHVSSLNVCIEITSEDKNDTLEKMKKLAEHFLDKYKLE